MFGIFCIKHLLQASLESKGGFRGILISVVYYQSFWGTGWKSSPEKMVLWKLQMRNSQTRFLEHPVLTSIENPNWRCKFTAISIEFDSKKISSQNLEAKHEGIKWSGWLKIPKNKFCQLEYFFPFFRDDQDLMELYGLGDGTAMDIEGLSDKSSVLSGPVRRCVTLSCTTTR